MIPTRNALAFLLLATSLALAASLPLDATPAGGLHTSDALCEEVKHRVRPVSNERSLLEARGSDKAEHKPLLPTNQFDVAMFVVAAIVLFIAAGAGMGGGPVLVPLYLTLGAFHQQAAVALSNSTILAGSVANVLVNARKRHPFRNKPLVEWDLILLMEPPTLIGAIAGSYTNKLLPAWISHLLLFILLTLMTVRVVQRARMIYRKETAARQQLAADHAAAAATTHHAGPAAAEGAAAAGADQTLAGRVDIAQRVPQGTSSIDESSMGGVDAIAQLELAEMVGRDSRAPCCATTAAAGNMSRLAASCSSSSANKEVAISHSKLASTLQPHNLQDIAPVQQQQQERRSSSEGMLSDGPPPSEVECRLAYAPPGHTRKGSLELANGWDDEWEIHSDEDDKDDTQLHGTASPWFAGAQGALESQSARVDCQVSSAESNALGAEGETAALSSGRALSAPVDGSLVLISPASPAAAAGLGGALRSSSISNRVRSFNTAILTPTAAAAAARPVSDARAVVHKLSHISTCVGADTSTSRVDSPFAKHQRPRSKQQPPELSVHSPELQAILLAEAAQLPWVPVLLLTALFVAVLLTSLFSKSAKCGSVAYWLVQWAVAPALLAVWAYSRSRVLHKVALKRQAGLDFHGDIRWNRHNSIIFPAICSFAGVIAGMFGLGGAVVKTPLMLELGVQPQVTAATTQTMLLLTTAASTIVYAQLGDIPWQYAAVMMPTAFVATLAGQFAIDWVVRKLGRSSVVVIVLAAFFVVACLLTLYIMIDSLRKVAADPVGATVPGKICS